MKKVRTIVAGQLPDFELPHGYGSSKPLGSTLARASTAYGHLRRMLAEHNDRLAELQADLRMPAENRPRARHERASMTKTAVAGWRAEYLEPIKAIAGGLRASLLRGDAVAKEVDPLPQQEIRSWLNSLPIDQRASAITRAIAEGDRQVLVSALAGPQAFGLLIDEQRELVAQQLSPDRARELVAHEAAVEQLRVGAEILEVVAGRDYDREIAASEAMAAQATALAARDQEEAGEGTPAN